MTRPDFVRAIQRVNASYAKAPVSRWTNVHDSQPSDRDAWEKRRAGRDAASKWMQQVVNTPRPVPAAVNESPDPKVRAIKSTPKKRKRA